MMAGNTTCALLQETPTRALARPSAEVLFSLSCILRPGTENGCLGHGEGGKEGREEGPWI